MTTPRCPAHRDASTYVAHGPWGERYAERRCETCDRPLAAVPWPTRDHAHITLIHDGGRAAVHRTRDGLAVYGDRLMTSDRSAVLARGTRADLAALGRAIAAAAKRGANTIDVREVRAHLAREAARQMEAPEGAPAAQGSLDLFDFPVAGRGDQPKNEGAPGHVRGETGAQRTGASMRRTREIAQAPKRASHAPSHARARLCDCGACDGVHEGRAA